MTTIFEALREDHEVQRRLAELLTETHGDSEGRKELFERLKVQLQSHASAEEKHFYTALLDRDQTREKARHSVAEHKDIDDAIEALTEMEFSSAQWLPKARQLAELVTHHLDEEEHEVFQMAGKVLSDNEKQELAGRYRSKMAEEVAERS